MKQSEINQEIVNSTHRMLEQIKALEVCPNTPNGNHYRPTNLNNENQSQHSDVLLLISSLQTDQSEELLKDVHNWSDSRVHTYETYEKPLLDQMEVNQKTDSTFIDEFSPQLEVNINNFDHKLMNAKEAVANLADSLIRQRCTDIEEASKDPNGFNQNYSSKLFQFQGTVPNDSTPPTTNQPDDYEQMRLRETHLVQIVTELSNEIESMSNEAVSKNLEMLNMQHEAEQKEKELNDVLSNNKVKEELIISFSSQIEELEQQLKSEKKKVEELTSLLNKNETEKNPPENIPQYSEISSQTESEIAKPIELSDDEKEIESDSQHLSTFRTIQNFSLDIDADEKFIQNQDQNKNRINFDQPQPTSESIQSTEEKIINHDRSNEFISDQSSPTTEFESLLKMEDEEFPGSSNRSSVLPLGIKRRQISTENGKRGNSESYSYRLFFKDREGGAVIVDAEVVRKDQKTGVMLLKPCDVRTASSPNKAKRVPFFNIYDNEIKNSNEIENSEGKNENDNKNDDCHQNSNLNEIQNIIDSNSQKNKSEKSDSLKNSNQNETKNNKINQNKENKNDDFNTNITNSNNIHKNITNNSKALTKHQEVMRRILEIHERQLAKIKAARAAAAASYYAVRISMLHRESLNPEFEEAKIIDLNKNVERQIRFDKNGNGEWSNFRSRPYESPNKQVLFGNVVVDSNAYHKYNFHGKQKIVQHKNRRVVVPNQPLKMKSPRKPFMK